MIKHWGIFTAIFIVGCNSTPTAQPNFFNGRYYMVGDRSCAQFNEVAGAQISCFDKDLNHTGYREAMTGEELLAYQIMLQRQQSSSQASYEPMVQNTMVASPPPFIPPRIDPIGQSNGGQIRCISTGIYSSCRYWYLSDCCRRNSDRAPIAPL